MSDRRSTRDGEFLTRAILRATDNVADGGGPFGAVIVGPDGQVVATGVNRVTASSDPTAHAEVNAIRAACAIRRDVSLAGCTLYASCEPCPLCLSAALWSRLDRVAYAADRQAAQRAGFDDGTFHDLFRINPHAPWPLVLEHLPQPSGQQPFDAWASQEDRQAY